MSGPTTWCRRFALMFVLLLFLLAGEDRSQPAAGAGPSDRDKLFAVKKDWGNPAQLKSWDPAAAPNHCNWTGITCATGGGGVVIGLTLSRLKLTSSVPASVCALESLAHLDLSYNNLTGAFPGAALYACAGLGFLDLSNNQFSGPLPREIDRLSSAMEHLNLSTNSFTGEVPPAEAGFPALRSLLLDTNGFTGEIPEAFSGLTELTTLSLAWNELSGSIPAWVWQHQKLRYIYLSYSGLSGELTRRVTALNLVEIDLSCNQLTGEIPEDFGNLKNLALLYLHNNQLTGTIPASIGLLPQLVDIRLFQNQLFGELPPELGKHSPLGNLEVCMNNLSGPLPESLCANGKLYNIVVFSNSFSGDLPAELGDCSTLDGLQLYNNNFSGNFPEKIWSFPKLTLVQIQNNSFTGTLPAQISPNISRIEMGNNMFSGSFPTSAPKLQLFHAENNRLVGELPSDMSMLANLTDLYVPGNRISGSIPTTMKLLQKMNSLNMSGNRLSGAIPQGSIGLLPALKTLDLSNNELTGSIPSDVRNVFNLLNLSSNQLTGEVPAQLQSAAYNQSFLGNRLCARADSGSGTNLPACSDGGRGNHNELSKGLIILFALLAAIVLVGSVGINIAWLLFRRRKKRQEVTDWKMTAFTQLNFSESDVLSNIREENVIAGSRFEKVYRVHLGNGNASHDEDHGLGGGGGDGRMVAVRRIWNWRKFDGMLEETVKSEVKVLGSIRHNNILRLLCCISSQEAKLLVYEYMENRNLDWWLHHRDREVAPAPLDWPTRLAIAVDAAKGLSYMHHDCVPPIVHCDIMSSNILLDPDFQAKIADFRFARILVKSGEPQSVSAIVGTFGYLAPEYEYRPEVNEKVDVYSFGVVLLELTTGKVANDSSADLCLAEWARRRYQRGASFDDIVDEAVREPAYRQDILSVFTLGVICTGKNPLTRPSMKEVMHRLIRCEQMAAEAEACQVSYERGGSGSGCGSGGAQLLESRKKGSRRQRWKDDGEDSGNFVVHVV